METINQLANALVAFGSALILLCALFGWRKGY